MSEILKCCSQDSAWAFICKDSTTYGVCNSCFHLDVFRYGIAEVVNLTTKEHFNPIELFGD